MVVHIRWPAGDNVKFATGVNNIVVKLYKMYSERHAEYRSDSHNRATLRERAACAVAVLSNISCCT